MNEHLARWTLASVAKYFYTVSSGLGLQYFVEGVDERNATDMEQEHAELRVNGPFVAEVSNNCYRVYIDINILLTDYMRMSSENAYQIDIWGGKFLSSMFSPIPIYKYGTGVDDDSTVLVGCLTQRRGLSEPIRLIRFGQVSRTDRIRQAAVDGRFEMILTTT